MMSLSSLGHILLRLAVTLIFGTRSQAFRSSVIANPTLSINNIPFSTRAHWMRVANAALADIKSPCPASAFATVIVNHSAPGLGELVCIGVNSAMTTDPDGPFKFTPSQAEAAFTELSLYTNAESCPMCASAIRWSGFREYIYGTSIDSLIEQGWDQIRVPSISIFGQSFDLPTQARLLGGVLTNETDPLFFWRFNPDFPCPTGCARIAGTCEPST
ncbi:hypothetical protein BD311DRAFT_60568 [Dichomitus squalens]|uniref:Cytidine deaminase-like protein n=1 Tax=Dichomitus squalens TaxID=114155 RepID=A0A4Q9MWY8_9APHY|nr:hypothetical protein BD311DRAFT_60568 [Dichomitus squalens]